MEVIRGPMLGPIRGPMLGPKLERGFRGFKDYRAFGAFGVLWIEFDKNGSKRIKMSQNELKWITMD